MCSGSKVSSNLSALTRRVQRTAVNSSLVAENRARLVKLTVSLKESVSNDRSSDNLEESLFHWV